MGNDKKSPRIYFIRCLLALLPLLLPAGTCLAVDVIGPDDALRISVYGYDDLKTETRVSADGRISFPLVGEVQAAGKTSIQLEKAIAGALVNGGFIREANVTVAILEHISQNVSVLGYVNKPGRYPLDSDSSIVDVIAMAGGVINDQGDRNNVIVTRTVNGRQEKIPVDLSDYLEKPATTTPFKMQQGDAVYVPKTLVFYIYGEVNHPGGYPLERELTVVKALSIAGGVTLRGSEDRIHIKRKQENGELEEIDAELSTPVLKDDVIYVSERWF